MNDDLLKEPESPLKEKNVFEQIYDVIIGKHTKQGLTLEQSQKVALWEIRDLILKNQRKTLYNFIPYTSHVTIGGLAETAEIATPSSNKQIGICSIIASVDIETYLSLGTAGGKYNILQAVYLAERGGLAISFNEPIPVGKAEPLWFNWGANAAGGNATLSMTLILDMEVEDR